MVGDAHGDALETGGDEVGYDRTTGEHEAQGAWPEALGKDLRPRVGHGDPRQVSGFGQVDDQGIEGRARLRLEDARDRARVQGIRTEAVDRLRGEGHEAALSQEARRFLDRPRLFDAEDAGLQAVPAPWPATVVPPRRLPASIPQAAWMSGPPE